MTLRSILAMLVLSTPASQLSRILPETWMKTMLLVVVIAVKENQEVFNLLGLEEHSPRAGSKP
jgi:hypothetical protein